MQEQRERADGGLTARVVGIVVAAGRSTRFGGSPPKQFLDLGGQSILSRSVRALTSDPRVPSVVVVLSPDLVSDRRGRDAAALDGVCAVVAGGRTRARSVLNGLGSAVGATHVLVHDAARPLASPRLVERVLDATLLHGAAVPVIPIDDTVKTDDGSGRVGTTLERGGLRLAQTPQGARVDWLRSALADALARGGEPTDESQALEGAGRSVVMVDGERGNVKITTRHDLEEARAGLGAVRPLVRVGSGYDVHRFAEGRRLVLGGVVFPGEVGLAGHSDADVVLHAAMDAVLGAAGLGDIGTSFPPADPRFEGADSRALAAEVAASVAGSGFVIVNLDLTVLAERPRIGSRAGAMREAVAAAFGVEPSRVSVKATTLEGLGALGRSEGIACQAVALLAAAGQGR